MIDPPMTSSRLTKLCNEALLAFFTKLDIELLSENINAIFGFVICSQNVFEIVIEKTMALLSPSM